MHLCTRCRAAVDVGRSHCTICDQPVPVTGDLTMPHPGSAIVAAPAPGAPYGHPYPGGHPNAGGHPTTGDYPVAPGYPGPGGYPTGAPGYPPQAYAAPVYGAPVVGYAPVPFVPVAAPMKSKATAALLCFFLGGLGIHRFYTGQVGLGMALLLTSLFLGWTVVWLVVTMVWVFIDFVLILTGGVRDQYGRPLV